jgi:hypothetical protein
VPNAPLPCDIISLVGPTSALKNTITFSRPVVNPFMAILSLGQPSIQVRYMFDQPFDVLSSGNGFFGGSPAGSLFEDPSNVLRGIEGHGTIQFLGTFTSISWSVLDGENWHGFTVGASRLPVSTVPEPISMTLLGTGLLGVAAAARRRRRKDAESTD